MAASAAQIARVRRMVAESDDSTYENTDIATYIEQYPIVDSAGYEPDDDDWTATYDLWLAAADILAEQARAVATEVNFGADGASFNLSEKQRNLLKQAELYHQRSREQLYRFPV